MLVCAIILCNVSISQGVESSNSTVLIPRFNVKENMTSVVYLLKVCNYTRQTPVEEFKKFWNGEFARNLRQCSMDNVQFDGNNNIVVEMYIPCKFTSVVSGFVVDATMLSDSNYNSFNFEWANYAVNRSEFNVTNYKYKMFVIPKNTPAKFYGLATLGCPQDDCFSWYNTETYVPNLFLHEIGHNMGLDHSRTVNDEYGDTTCVMGNQPNRCWNAAHRYTLGWSEPRLNLLLGKNSVNLRASVTLSTSEFIKVNQAIFMEYVDLSAHPNKIPLSLHVYQLNMNLSTLLLCSMSKIGDVCQVTTDTSFTIKIANMSDTEILFGICVGSGNCQIVTGTPPKSDGSFRMTLTPCGILLNVIVFMMFIVRMKLSAL